MAPMPTIAEAMPRRSRGNRSGMIAVRGACRALSATWIATTQKTVIYTIEESRAEADEEDGGDGGAEDHPRRPAAEP